MSVSFMSVVQSALLLLTTIIQLSSCSLICSQTSHKQESEIAEDTFGNIIEKREIVVTKTSKHTLPHVAVSENDDLQRQLSKPNTVFVIRNNLDLKGSKITLGKNTALVFEGGSILNGTLVGYNTEIAGTLKGIFENIHIKGVWNVPFITTDMWQNLDYSNSLQDVFSLLNADIQNKLILEKEKYSYKLVAPSNGRILRVLDNTELIINGDIVLEPNGIPSYEMFYQSSCKNVNIHGSGSVSGDKEQHDYTTVSSSHEWGAGFVFRSSHNIEISGITIKNLTGDALCLMDNCSDFKIHDLTLRDCRRCGISIRADHDITIDNCTITGIVNDEYNQPSAAIDIEPVVPCEVYNVVIRNSYFCSNARGVSSNARAYYGGSCSRNGKTMTEERHYINLEIADCHFENSTYTSFIVPMGWETVTIKGCSFHNGRQDDIRAGYTKNCIIENCTTSCDENMRKSTSRSFVTNQFDNGNISVVRCTGSNVKRIFSDERNCRLLKSNIITR